MVSVLELGAHRCIVGLIRFDLAQWLGHVCRCRYSMGLVPVTTPAHFTGKRRNALPPIPALKNVPSSPRSPFGRLRTFSGEERLRQTARTRIEREFSANWILTVCCSKDTEADVKLVAARSV